MAHNTANISAQRKTHHTQLKMTSTENLSLFLVLVFFAGWSSSCLLLLWSLLTLKLAGGKWKKKKKWCWITTNAVKTDNLAAQSTTESVFLFHLLLWACLLHKRMSTSRESYWISAAESTCQSVKPGRTAVIIRRQTRRQWSKDTSSFNAEYYQEAKRLHQTKKFTISVGESDFNRWRQIICKSSNTRLNIVTPFWRRGMSLFLSSSSLTCHLRGSKEQSLVT